MSPGLCVGGGEFVPCFPKAQSLHCIRGVDAAGPCVLLDQRPYSLQADYLQGSHAVLVCGGLRTAFVTL